MDTRQPLPPASAFAADRGFTAIELMVVVAIVAVLATLAAPSFIPQIESWRIRQAAESMKSSLFFARSEAIKRGGKVAMSKLENNTNGCSSATNTDNWDCGWFVCDDANDNGKCDATETVLQRYDAPANIEVRSTGQADIGFTRWGTVGGTWPGFTLVPKGKNTSSPAARGVCMGAGGRIQTIPGESTPCT